MPSYPDFPLGEYENRYARARSLMQKDGLDALLVTEEKNYIYFTGHRSQQNPIDKIRPYVFLLPKDDSPSVITVEFELDPLKDATWITDVRIGGLMGYDGSIVSLLNEKRLSNARIGVETGTGQYMGIPFNTFEEIRRAVPGAKFVDASRILHALRGTKSPRELEYVRKAATITAKAAAATFADSKVGMTELDVARTLRIHIASLGGENVTFMWVVTSKNGMIANPTERVLEDGDVLVLDFGAEYRGYASDIARTAAIGTASAQVDEFYRWMLDVRRECVNELRAGLTPRDVLTVCREAIDKRGIPTLQLDRIGHGVGLQSVEFPSLGMGKGQTWPGEENTVFEPGMVLACNPTFVPKFGWINAEDMWAITQDAPELLSSPVAPPKIPVIA